MNGNYSTFNALFASLWYYTLIERTHSSFILYAVKISQWLSTTVDNLLSSQELKSSLFRFITMQALDIRHTCHIYWPFHEIERVLIKKVERLSRKEAEQLELARRQECEEIMDDMSDLVDELDILVHEFEEEYQKQSVGIEEFCRGYWTTRIEEVRRQRLEPLSAEEKQSLREIGVVLEEKRRRGGQGYVIYHNEVVAGRWPGRQPSLGDEFRLVRWIRHLARTRRTLSIRSSIFHFQLALSLNGGARFFNGINFAPGASSTRTRSLCISESLPWSRFLFKSISKS